MVIEMSNNESNEELSTAEVIRRKQKLKNILTIIGESLQDFFKQKIEEEYSHKPSLITIEEVNSVEKQTSKSKVHLVSYQVNSNIGRSKINLLVKFASDNERFNNEIENHHLLKSATAKVEGFYTPEIVYKNERLKCIIYEGVEGKSFRASNLDKNHKYKSAGKMLAVIHSNQPTKVDVQPYKKLILYIVSTFGDAEIEKKIVTQVLPYLKSIETSKGGVCIHGDYHGGNLLIQTAIEEKNNTPEIRMFVIDPEFAMKKRDRCEDIGTFFSKPVFNEYKNYGNINETVKNFKAFLKGYNEMLKETNAGFFLQDLYPDGLTVDFHIIAYMLYFISTQLFDKGKSLFCEDVNQCFSIIDEIVQKKPFSG